MSRKILIADDEQRIVDTLRAYLENDGFEVVSARNGLEALDIFHHAQPDLAILDIMMPDIDGWEVARLIRRESAMPIFFLTARVDDIDQIMGLEIGADEYITKPFSPRVVVAKVRALLRRIYGDFPQATSVWTVGDLQLNAETHLVTIRGERIDLTPSEFNILQTLMMRPGRVFTRMELLDQLQGEAFAAYERTIDVHVKNLRNKIEADSRAPDYIETVYGVGYRMKSDHE